MDDSQKTKAEFEAHLVAQLQALDDDSLDIPQTVSFEEEVQKAAGIKDHARLIVGKTLEDARMGQQVSLEPVNDAVREMADSMFRNPVTIL